jgi:hypothetical protein
MHRLEEEAKGGGGCWGGVPPCHPLSLPDSRLQSLSRTTNFAARKQKRAEMLFASDLPTHARSKKQGAARIGCF